ncbi:ATP-binding cassette domain-containing protein [Shigella flexneri]
MMPYHAERPENAFPGMDKPAVAPLDCTIHAGYVTGWVGPDGAGKTTLMRMLAGLLKTRPRQCQRSLAFDPIRKRRRAARRARLYAAEIWSV